VKQTSVSNAIKKKSNYRVIQIFKLLINITCFIIPVLILSTLFQSRYNQLEPLYKVKLEQFSQLKDNVDLVFIGRSTTWRNIITSEFDKELEKYNINLVSFNFAFPTMRYGEVLFLLKEIKKIKPKKLKFIILETAVKQYSSVTKLKDTRKFIFWHNFKNTVFAIKNELIYSKQKKMLENFFNVYQHLKAFYFKTIIKSNGFFTLNYFFKINSKQLKRYTIFNEKIIMGNLTLDKYIGLKHKRHQSFLTKGSIGFFNKIRKKVINLKFKKINLYNSRKEFYDLLIDWSKAMKTNLIFFTAPLSNKKYFKNNNDKYYDKYFIKTDINESYPILSLDDPHKYPTLFKSDRRFDAMHLNALGAKEASKHLAQIFLHYIQQESNKKKYLIKEEIVY